RLVTSGAVDWAGTSWGERPVRFAKRRWRAPVLDPDPLAGAPAPAPRRAERSRGPEVVAPPQTRDAQAAGDAGGGWVAPAPAAARRGVERSGGPKLVVASQTRVVEAAVDEEGSWVPSVPALAVLPADPADLWLVAAAVLSPAATAWLARRSAGTALDRHGI